MSGVHLGGESTVNLLALYGTLILTLHDSLSTSLVKILCRETIFSKSSFRAAST